MGMAKNKFDTGFLTQKPRKDTSLKVAVSAFYAVEDSERLIHLVCEDDPTPGIQKATCVTTVQFVETMELFGPFWIDAAKTCLFFWIAL
jgi:hypothetical protein